MNELINAVAQRTGLSPEQAQQAVEAMVEFMRARLPAPIAAQLEAFLAGGGDLSSVEQMAKGALGGIFGGNK